jgi:hypothetical protein
MGDVMTVTEEQKAAMTTGRREGRAVRLYLEALRYNRRSSTTAEGKQMVQESLSAIRSELADNPTVQRELELVEERLRLLRRLAGYIGRDRSFRRLEDAFVEVAASYAARKGISYRSFREVGVSIQALRRAGIPRGGPL